ncbi:universal stress protein [Streptomyces sioyaensis]|uniref:universal stress protein n=1 Tax=Streptomyces sioyaensis TaxID=67364 RepID=UPI00379B9079
MAAASISYERGRTSRGSPHGSPESLAAAHWAADEAERRKLTLCLLHAWPRVPLRAVHGPRVPLHAYASWGGDHAGAEEITQEAQKHLSQALTPWREKFPDVVVVDTTRLESPAEAVVRAAEGAELLIIGRHKHRASLAQRLGPVAQAAIHHARCPVAVVPHG